MVNIKFRIEEKLKTALSPSYLEVIDESYLHKGHVGARPEGETHFRIVIEAEILKNLPSIKRHKLIYEILSEEMKIIHAISIDAKNK